MFLYVVIDLNQNRRIRDYLLVFADMVPLNVGICTVFRWKVSSFAPVTTSHISLHTLVSYLKRQHHRICQLFGKSLSVLSFYASTNYRHRRQLTWIIDRVFYYQRLFMAISVSCAGLAHTCKESEIYLTSSITGNNFYYVVRENFQVNKSFSNIYKALPNIVC